MAKSQNGWPVVAASACTDRALYGAEFPNGWLKGDVDVIFTHLIGKLHHEVEPILNPGCWGFYVKKIEGSDAYSNHSSGTAIDYNAPNHPMGSRNTYSTANRNRIHSILAYYEGVVRWGGDYSGRPDDMHFEINRNQAETSRVADKIRGPRVLDEITYEVKMGILQEGDKDSDRDGYDVIRRIQRLVFDDKTEWDGEWGAKTTAALGYNKMNEERYRKLFAGTRP